MNHRPFTVLTTIQPPTPSVLTLATALRPLNCPLIVIGDKKGPAHFSLEGAELIALEAQSKLPYKLAPLLPVGHYARKNLGYLIAFSRGATSIYETDDDNAPLSDWRWRERKVKAQSVSTSGWVNVYRYFSEENIWPRGLPLDAVTAPVPAPDTTSSEFDCPMQQGLANGSPDVDAVWRLVLDKNITFKAGPSIYLPRGAWCPCNTQSTWWWPPAFPLMYLPSFCSFRMTDIWKSFVAQRCLWELGTGVVFHAAEVFQQRNVHNLMRDFQDEISGYMKNREIAKLLSDLSLKSGPAHASENLLKCYEHLVANKIFPPEELPLVRAWIEDVEACLR